MSRTWSYPRAEARNILRKVFNQKMILEDAFESLRPSIDPNVEPWLQEVCSGVLRWKGRLDAALDAVAFSKKPSGDLRKILMLASYQILFQDHTPAACVVSETVDFLNQTHSTSSARFANAVLRKLSLQAQLWRNWPFPDQASHATQAQWASLPQLLWEKILHQHGLAWAQAYAKASLERPLIWLRTSPDFSLSQQTIQVKPGPYAHSWQLCEGGAVFQKSGFTEGQWIVQDLSSQRLVQDVGQFLHQQTEDRDILDLCAAPGGKAIALAWLGFHVTACEKNLRRKKLLVQNQKRTQVPLKILSWEQLSTCSQKTLVWVDAPCSSSGLLRRHPDVRWFYQAQDIVRWQDTVQELVIQAWSLVKPGGYLMYSVCSILKEEGPWAWERWLKNPLFSKALCLQEWFICPQQVPSADGFWALLLQKKA